MSSKGAASVDFSAARDYVYAPDARRDGSLPAKLVAEAERLAELREGADYDAVGVEREQAERAVRPLFRWGAAMPQDSPESG